MSIVSLIHDAWDLKRTGQMTRPELEQQQLSRFRALVRHAVRHAPYYRDLVKQHGIDVDRCQVEDFPELRKKDVAAHFDRIVTRPEVKLKGIQDFLAQSTRPDELFKDNYHVIHTSGSSGELGYFIYDRKEWTRGGLRALRYGTLGLRRKYLFIGATSGHYAGVSMAQTMSQSFMSLFITMRCLEVNQPTEDLLREADKFKPDVLVGYATALRMLAEAQLQGRINIKPLELSSGGEPLIGEDRRLLEQAFGIGVTNVYASSEHLLMGFVPTHSSDLILFEDDLIFELRPDHTLVTNLFNRTMPLIRYRMNDVLEPTDWNPMPTSPLPAFRRCRGLVGRREAAPWFRNDKGELDSIHPIVIVEFYVKGLRAFQIEHEGERSFTFRAQLELRLPEAEKATTLAGIARKLDGILRDKGMTEVQYGIHECDELKVDPKTGKFRLILAKPPHGLVS